MITAACAFAIIAISVSVLLTSIDDQRARRTDRILALDTRVINAIGLLSYRIMLERRCISKRGLLLPWAASFRPSRLQFLLRGNVIE